MEQKAVWLDGMLYRVLARLVGNSFHVWLLFCFIFPADYCQQ